MNGVPVAIAVASPFLLITLAAARIERARALDRAGSRMLGTTAHHALRGSGWTRDRFVGSGLVAGGGILGFAIAGVPGLAAGGVAGVLGGAWRRRRRKARTRERLDEQLADASLAIGAGMRAGLSLTQALSYAVGEVEPPLDEALAHLVDAVGLGTPLDDALTVFAGTIDTDDARLAVGALRLHRRSGGDLPMVLDQVGAALRERRSAAREVRALTAQARLSGAILGLLPIGFFAFLSVTSRRDIAAAYQTRAGFVAIVLGLVLEGAAFLWIRRLLEVR